MVVVMHWFINREQMLISDLENHGFNHLRMIKQVYVKRRKTVNNYSTMHNTNGSTILSRI